MKIEPLEPKIYLCPPFQDLFLFHQKKQNVIPKKCEQPKRHKNSSNFENCQKSKKVIKFWSQYFQEKKKNSIPKISDKLQKSTSRPTSMMNIGIWSEKEHDLFLKGYEIHGHKWSLIAKYWVLTRSRSQVASHAQKYFQKSK
eukprot:gene3956-7212_t